MSTYHLQARLFIGPMRQPARDEVRTAQSDSWAELHTVADQLVATGFTVWIFDHGAPNPIPNASDYRLLTRLVPTPPAARPATPPTSARPTTTRRR